MTDTTAGVIDDAGTRRRQQLRNAQARKRSRRRLGLVVRPIELESEWLDALEERGYLDPYVERGVPSAECAAVRKLLADMLDKKHDFA